MGWLTKRLPKKRWKRVAVYAGSTFLVVLAADMALTRVWRGIKISRETTYITSPLNAAGTPDYSAWLNEKMGQGATPENNAAVPIIRALGTSVLSLSSSQEWQEAVLKRVGLPGASLPAKLTVFPEWAKTHASGDEKPGVATQRNGASAGGPELTNQEAQMLAAPWKAAEHPLWAQWLESQKDALALAHEAAGRTHCFFPLEAGSARDQPGEMIMILFPALGQIRYLGNMLLAEAQMHAGDADKTVFINDVIDALKYASLLTGHPIVIEHLVGVVLERDACKAVLAALGGEEDGGHGGGGEAAQGAGFHAADARRLLAAMETVPAIGPLDFEGERCEMLDVWCYEAVFGFAHSPLGKVAQPALAPVFSLVTPIHFNAQMREINDGFNHLEEAQRIPSYARRIEAVRVAQTELYSLGKKLVFHFSGVDRVTDDTWLARTSDGLESAAMQRELTRVALALAVYKQETAEYPAALEALVGAGRVLTEIPKDGFTDLPLKYRRDGAGYVLYSVGGNLKDDGGDGKVDDKGATLDIVVRMTH